MSTMAGRAAGTGSGHSMWRINCATFIGTALEWYDFFIYGTAAALVFNTVFFPNFDPNTGILLSFGTFAIGFVARPLGAALFGYYGDTVGRKNVLTATMFTMGIATMLIGLLPGYDTIGIAAPVLLIMVRIVQGIGIGGEWGGAIILAAEHGDAKRRGLHTSWTQIGVPAGNLLSFAVLTVVTSMMPNDQFAQWGWRIPFLLSALLVLVGLWIRWSLEETPVFESLQEQKRVSASPIMELLRAHPRELAIACFSRVGVDVMFYTVTLFTLSYTTSKLGLPRSVALNAVLIGSALLLVLVPCFAALSDKVGRRPVFLTGAACCVMWIFAYFSLLNTKDPWMVILAVAFAMALWSMMYGPIAAFITGLFPANIRYSGTSLGIQLAGLFGGSLAPLISTELGQRFNSTVAVAIYVSIAIAVSAVAVLMTLKMPERTD
jgi:metabolite-proton symporter